MKSISASLVVLSGALILVASSFRSDDFGDVTLPLGGAVVVIGLAIWFVTVFKMD